MIKFLKLVTGDDIVGRVKKIDNNYSIECPVKLLIEMTAEGKPISRVEPFIPHLKDQIITLSEDKILLMGEPNKDLVGYYLTTYLHPWDAVVQNMKVVNES